MYYVALLLGLMIPDALNAHITDVVNTDHIVMVLRDEISSRVGRGGADGGCDTHGPWQTTTHRVKNDSRDLKWARRGCRLEVHIEGDVAFNDDLSAISRIARGGSVEFEQRGGTRRELKLVPRRDGRVGISYKEDGRPRPLDGAARAWMGEMVQLLLRSTGMEADRRVALLLRQGGHDAVLAELPHLAGDRVQRRYLAELMTQARLNGAAYAATLRAASENLSSEQEWSDFLEESGHRAGGAARSVAQPRLR